MAIVMMAVMMMTTTIGEAFSVFSGKKFANHLSTEPIGHFEEIKGTSLIDGAA